MTFVLVFLQCKNLTSDPIGTVDEYPPLYCAVSTCASDSLNYTVLFIVSATITTLILIICIVQSVQTRRRTIKSVTVLNPEQSLIQSLSTTQTSVNRWAFMFVEKKPKRTNSKKTIKKCFPLFWETIQIQEVKTKRMIFLDYWCWFSLYLSRTS